MKPGCNKTNVGWYLWWGLGHKESPIFTIHLILIDPTILITLVRMTKSLIQSFFYENSFVYLRSELNDHDITDLNNIVENRAYLPTMNV